MAQELPEWVQDGERKLTEGVRTMQRREAISRWVARIALFLAGAATASGAMALAGWL
jgi:hypothetical protein